MKLNLHLGIILILATFLLSSCTNPENDENLENNEVQVPVDETRPEETASEITSSEITSPEITTSCVEVQPRRKRNKNSTKIRFIKRINNLFYLCFTFHLFAL